MQHHPLNGLPLIDLFIKPGFAASLRLRDARLLATHPPRVFGPDPVPQPAQSSPRRRGRYRSEGLRKFTQAKRNLALAKGSGKNLKERFPRGPLLQGVGLAKKKVAENLRRVSGELRLKVKVPQSRIREKIGARVELPMESRFPEIPGCRVSGLRRIPILFEGDFEEEPIGLNSLPEALALTADVSEKFLEERPIWAGPVWLVARDPRCLMLYWSKLSPSVVGCWSLLWRVHSVSLSGTVIASGPLPSDVEFMFVAVNLGGVGYFAEIGVEDAGNWISLACSSPVLTGPDSFESTETERVTLRVRVNPDRVAVLSCRLGQNETGIPASLLEEVLYGQTMSSAGNGALPEATSGRVSVVSSFTLQSRSISWETDSASQSSKIQSE